MGNFVERVAQDGVLVPVDDPQDRFGEFFETRKIIELDSQYVVRGTPRPSRSLITWSCAVVLPLQVDVVWSC